MSEDDVYDKQAAELLPCIGQGWISSNEMLCPPELPSCYACVNRPVVAAALREQGEEIERLKELDRIGRENHDRLVADNACLKAEIIKLKARIAEQDEQLEAALNHHGGCNACGMKDGARWIDADELQALIDAKEGER